MQIKKIAMLFIACCLSMSLGYAATVDDYTRLPEREKVSVSPDGSKVVFQQNKGGKRLAIIYDVENKQLVKAFDLDQLNARQVYFLTDNVVIFNVSEVTRISGTKSAEYSMAQAFDIKADKIRPTLTLGEGVYLNQTGLGTVIGTSADGKYAYMPAYTDAGSIVDATIQYSVMRVNLKMSTKPKNMFSGDRSTMDYIVDAKGKVLAQVIMDGRRDKFVVKGRGDKKLKEIYVENTKLPALSLLGVNSEQTHVYFSWQNDNVDEHAIKLMSLATGEVSNTSQVAPGKDIVETFIAKNRVVQGVRYAGLRPSYSFFDPQLDQRIKAITAMFPSESVYISSISDDLKSVVARIEGSQYAGDFVLFRDGRDPFMIGSQRPNISPEDISPMATWGFKASDGLRIPVLLTIPASKAGNISPMPTVVLPHGGPASHDELGFDWITQILASKGYLVIQPQFRGSSGFGYDHYQAGQGEWGQKMQDDVTESVKALIKKGYVDANNVCIMGWSYGGYSALAGGAFTPDMYRCVVSINGVSDLHALLVTEKKENSRNSWVVDYWKAQMAEDKKPTASYLKSLSPADHAEKFEAPVLLIHGEEDRVVRTPQAKTMASALNKAGKPVELKIIKGDGHSMIQQGSRVEMMNYILPFLDQHLGQ